METVTETAAQTMLETFCRLPVTVRKELLKQLIDAVDQPVANDEMPRNGQVFGETKGTSSVAPRENPLPMTPRFVRRTGPPKDRSQEFAWVAAHREEYAGQWVALTGEQLVAHGADLSEVHRKAQEAGIVDAIILSVEGSDALPFIGF
jgi:hypothetical protein